jgi:hypothetical protein
LIYFIISNYCSVGTNNNTNRLCNGVVLRPYAANRSKLSEIRGQDFPAAIPVPLRGLSLANFIPNSQPCQQRIEYLAGKWQMTGLTLPEDYWREVFKGAWKNTLRGVGWDATKVILAVATLLGAWILGVTLAPVTMTEAFLIGIAILAPIIFVWGMVQAQADMYGDLKTKQSTPVVVPPVQAPSNHLATPKPDFDMWRHRETLTLLEAAQLWAEVNSCRLCRSLVSRAPQLQAGINAARRN